MKYLVAQYRTILTRQQQQQRIGSKICNHRYYHSKLDYSWHQSNVPNAWNSTSHRNLSTTTPDSGSDVLVIGGGVVGTALVNALQQSPTLKIALVEAKDQVATTINTDIPAPRSYALSPASLKILGLPEHHHRLGYYQSMQVWEAKQPSTLIFTAQDIAEQHLGAVVEDAVLVEYLWNQIDPERTTTFTGTTVANIQIPSHASKGLTQVQLEQNGKQTLHETKLLVAADGAKSRVRQQLGIDTIGLQYNKSALSFTVRLATEHHGRAFQRFLATGPLALLPTFSKNHAIVVWSTSPEEAQQWKDHPELVQRINSLLQQGPDPFEPILDHTKLPPVINNLWYGLEKLLETAQYGPAMLAGERHPFVTPPLATQIESPQFSFPLSCRQVTAYTKPRVALIGDAAHTIHPLAGQGLNLGLQDVASLAESITKASNAGMDVTTFLNEFERSRRLQVSATLAGIHTIEQMFGIQHVLAKHAKSFGMNVIQNIGPIRKQLVQAAAFGVNIK